LKKKRNYYHSFDTLSRSVWVGLVLVGNDLEALADDEEDHDEQETLDNVHLLEEKEKLLPI
jgi:predicted P-loop ATPase/GTPase